jgi:7-cyano-7-deazaguanine synthase in queuosine biosynthesis
MSANQAHQFVLVSGVTNSRQQAGQRKQVRAIGQLLGHCPIHVTVPLRRSWREVQRAEEWSQRGRGFLFLTLGAATALAVNNQELSVFENGIGAINLPINATQVGTYSSRAVNPLTLTRMENFIRLLTGASFKIHNPFLYRTKGEMCNNEVVAVLASLVSETFSCDGFPVRAHGCPQCGTCSSCVLRRISLLHANLIEHDQGYLVDVFDATKTLTSDQQYVLRAMYWQARGIAECLGSIDAWQALIRVFPILAKIEDLLVTNSDQDRQLIRSSLLRLYQQYIEEWNQFQSRCALFLAADQQAA